MSGAVRSVWSWAACGKHPSAGDYIRTGHWSPLTNSFAEWVEKGYSSLASVNKPQRPVAWRFWARGLRNEDIICGLIRDSSDRVGRRYPLLIVGTGPLNDWEGRWDLLPFAFDGAWEQIEYISAQRVDINMFGSDIQNIRPPHPEWREYGLKQSGLTGPASQAATGSAINILEDMKSRASALIGKPEGMVRLDQSAFGDQFTMISWWHAFLKQNGPVPNAVFMGGTFEQSYMTFFNRALQTSDFIRLWTMPAPGE